MCEKHYHEPNTTSEKHARLARKDEDVLRLRLELTACKSMYLPHLQDRCCYLDSCNTFAALIWPHLHVGGPCVDGLVLVGKNWSNEIL